MSSPSNITIFTSMNSYIHPFVGVKWICVVNISQIVWYIITPYAPRISSCHANFNKNAIIKPNYDSCSRSNKNHCISELSYPALSAICVGSIVMLLKDYIVEEKLMNGYIGTVIEIIYDDRRGPNILDSLPLYVIVNFLESTLQTILISNRPSTHIPIPITTDRCK